MVGRACVVDLLGGAVRRARVAQVSDLAHAARPEVGEAASAEQRDAAQRPRERGHRARARHGDRRAGARRRRLVRAQDQLHDALALELTHHDALLDRVDLLAGGAQHVRPGVERERTTAARGRQANAVERDLGREHVLAVRVGDRDHERGDAGVDLGEPAHAFAADHCGTRVAAAGDELGAARDELPLVPLGLAALGGGDALGGRLHGRLHGRRRSLRCGVTGEARARGDGEGTGSRGEPHAPRLPRRPKILPKRL